MEEKKDDVVSMSREELQAMIDSAVSKVVSPAEKKRRLRNEDFEAQATGPAIQTQESVVQLAASTGGSSNGPGFVPGVPGFVAVLDHQEHQDLIAPLEQMGYRITLNRVEWRVRWEPTDRMQTDSGMANVKVDRPEPAEAEPLLRALQERDPRYSRVFIQTKLNRGITIGAERQLMEWVARDERNEKLEDTGGRNFAAEAVDTLEKVGVAAVVPTGDQMGVGV